MRIQWWSALIHLYWQSIQCCHIMLIGGCKQILGGGGGSPTPYAQYFWSACNTGNANRYFFVLENDVKMTSKRHNCILDIIFLLKYLPFVQKIELKHIICNLGSTLTRKHKHAVLNHGYRKVTARGRSVPWLLHLKNNNIKTRQKKLRKIVKYRTINIAIKKYCLRDFIWMVTLKDFIRSFKS